MSKINYGTWTEKIQYLRKCWLYTEFKGGVLYGRV